MPYKTIRDLPDEFEHYWLEKEANYCENLKKKGML